jgi:hypothetical protein
MPDLIRGYPNRFLFGTGSAALKNESEYSKVSFNTSLCGNHSMRKRPGRSDCKTTNGFSMKQDTRLEIGKALTGWEPVVL